MMTNEKRLIDANALLKIYENWIPQLMLPEDAGDKRGVETCIAVLQDAPTVDAVEIVRCEFCKNAEPYDCTINGTVHRLYECKKDKTAIGYNKVVAKDDFCSCGERKVGDRNG